MCFAFVQFSYLISLDKYIFYFVGLRCIHTHTRADGSGQMSMVVNTDTRIRSAFVRVLQTAVGAVNKIKDAYEWSGYPK